MEGNVTLRRSGHIPVGVGAARGALRRATLDVLVHRGLVNSGGRRLFRFKRPLFLRAVDLAKVVNAGVLLCGRARFHEVRNRDRSEEADDGHHDHDFNQREAGFPIGFVNVHTVLFAA